jgi:thiamine-phosphate pyrophosphorylase
MPLSSVGIENFINSDLRSMKPFIGRLHVITDTTLQRRYSHAELAELAIRGGADTIQYRSKSSEIRRMIREAGEVRDICNHYGIPFIVNDRVDLCLAVDADGVHLGLEDMPVPLARRILGPEKLIGGTVRNRTQLEEAAGESADYVGLGPIFGTISKRVDVDPLGLEIVREVSRDSPIPVIAIAGITSLNAREVFDAGAHGVAVIGAVCCADDVAGAASALRRALDSDR